MMRLRHQNRSVASLIAIGYIAYAANNFLALIYLNYKVNTAALGLSLYLYERRRVCHLSWSGHVFLANN